MKIRAANPMTRAAVHSKSFLDVGQRTDAGSRVTASAMPGTVDATCMAGARPAHPGANATADGAAASTRRKPVRNGAGSAI